MNIIRIIWPLIADTESAKKASNIAWMTVFVLNVISVINLVGSYIWIKFISHKEFFFDIVMQGVIGILVFALIGFFIKKNNKIAVLLPIIMMVVDGTGPNIIIGLIQLFKIVFIGSQLQPVDYGSWYGISAAIILATIYINGIRGVFAYHKFVKLEFDNLRKDDDRRWAI